MRMLRISILRGIKKWKPFVKAATNGLTVLESTTGIVTNVYKNGMRIANEFRLDRKPFRGL